MRGLELPVRTVIGLAIVPGLVAVATLVFGVREPPREVLPAPKKKEETTRAKLPAPILRYLVVLAVFTLGSSADSFLLLRVVDLGLDAAWVPLVWLALSGAKSLSNMPGGWIGDRFGRKRTLVIAWAFYAIVYAAAPHVASPIAFAALVVVYGAYYGLSEGSERAILAERAPPELRGRAFGAMHAVTGLAVLPANLIFGALYTQSASLAFGFGAACAGLATILLAVLVRPIDAHQSA
jgi:MFS family permease